MKSVSTLIFDLDGTISDPSLGILRSYNFVFEAHGFPEITEKRVSSLIGPPLDEGFLKICPDADKPLLLSLIGKYRERYAEVGYSENTIYPGVSEALDVLNATGTRVGVCTSKRKDFVEKILNKFDLQDRFSFINGGDTGIKKQEQLAHLLQAKYIDGASIIIGDRAIDISSVKANKLRSVGVLWGFGDFAELQQAGADSILSDTFQLGKLGI